MPNAQFDSLLALIASFKFQFPDWWTQQTWLWMLIFGVLIFCTFYLGLYSGDFSPDPWLQSSEPVAQSTVGPPTSEPVSGSQIYSFRCVPCHQSNGRASRGAFRH